MKFLWNNQYNKWKKSLYGSLVLAAFLIMCAPGLEAEESAAEKQLLGLINQARTSPLLMAEMAGLDKEAVLDCFADRRYILENGLRLLSVNQKLGQTASAHTEEMLQYQYYDNTSIQGLSPKERMVDAGYNPLAAAERIGIIGFRNFMESEQAVWELFRNMFRDELACEKNQDWHILNPEFSEIGISVQAGSMAFGKNKTNIYITTCDFGASNTGKYAAKRLLLQTINHARKNPAAAVAALDMDFEAAAGHLGRNGWILMLGTSPVAVNEDLFAYADAVSTELPAPGETGELEVPGVFSMDALESLYQELEYRAEKAVRISAVSFFGDNAPDPQEAMESLFLQILEAGIKNPERAGDLMILNPDYTETGIGYRLFRVENTEGMDEFYGMLTCVLAAPQEASPRIVGRISWGNAEELPVGLENAVDVADPDMVERADLCSTNGLMVRIEAVPVEQGIKGPFSVYFTDPAGGYSLSLPQAENHAGAFRLTVSRPGEDAENQPLHSEDFSYYHTRNLLKDIQLEKDGVSN